MRQLNALVLFAFVVCLSGCVVPSNYSKSIVVKKDASGKVLEIVETETVLQHGQGYPIKFEYLKDVQRPGYSREAVEKEAVESGQSGYEFRRNK